MDPRVNQLAADSLQEQGKQPKLKMPENQAGCERAGFRGSERRQRRSAPIGIESDPRRAGKLAADSMQKQQAALQRTPNSGKDHISVTSAISVKSDISFPIRRRIFSGMRAGEYVG
jgi:hypothetical protein